MRTILTLFLLLVLPIVYGQVKVTGRVTDMHGAPIPGANVVLKGSYDGASSGGDGSYVFETDAAGAHLLVATFLGYKNFEQQIVIQNQPVRVDFRLEETISELKAVTITAGTFGADDQSRRTIFKAIDIATTAGATADIAGALNTLPGTQKVGETGRLFVRGGDSNETRTFIDGMMVLDSYAVSAPNTPSRGRFLPFMFKGTSFSTGGYTAEYGQALSSVLALDSRDKAEATRTDIGILSVGADVSHTHAWDRASVAAKIQYTNIRPYFGLISQEIDWITPPASLEGVGVYRQQVGKNGLFKCYGNFNHTDFSMYNHNIRDYNDKVRYALTNDYRYMNGSYKDVLNENWSVRGGVSYTSIQNRGHIESDQVLETQHGIHAKVAFDGSLSDQLSVRTGAEIIQRNDRQSFASVSGSSNSLGFEEEIVAGFAEADIYASNNFVSRAGVRLEYQNLTSRLSVDPRVSIAYKTSSYSQISLAYGTFRQSAKADLLRVNQTLATERATHYILNYQWVENKRTFRIEAYYKRYDDLVKFIAGNPLMLNNAGNGFAKGIELFWRDNSTIKNADYWISYSFLDSQRDFLNYPHQAIPAFASAHNFSFVYKHFIPVLKSQCGVTYSFATPRRYNDPNSEAFNASKTPYYADLSANIAYLPKPYLILFLSCTNLLGRDNIFGYTYSPTPDVEGVYPGRAVRQAAPRFLFVGIFITLSKDKTMNQLRTL